MHRRPRPGQLISLPLRQHRLIPQSQAVRMLNGRINRRLAINPSLFHSCLGTEWRSGFYSTSKSVSDSLTTIGWALAHAVFGSPVRMKILNFSRAKVMTVGHCNAAQFLGQFFFEIYKPVEISVESAANCKTNWYLIVVSLGISLPQLQAQVG